MDQIQPHPHREMKTPALRNPQVPRSEELSHIAMRPSVYPSLLVLGFRKLRIFSRFRSPLVGYLNTECEDS